LGRDFAKPPEYVLGWRKGDTMWKITVTITESGIEITVEPP
jgi:hypothetical protein